MNKYCQDNTRKFGKEFQNIFNFLNKPKNIKQVSQNSQNENPAQDIKKQNLQKKGIRRNTVYMRFSDFPLKDINNIEKVNKAPLDVIKEEKENIPASRKTMINFNDTNSNAITKGAVVINKIKEEKIEVKDYFHALVDDYGDDIFRYLQQNEKVNISDYSNNDIFRLQDKKHFNEKNRSIILHWLIKNNSKWKLKDDTIYMAMNLMDRYISKFKSQNSEFQLIAISSYLIASKYEDIYPPYIEELSQICNYIYSTDDIIRKEYEILAGLNFDILYNSSYKYLTFLHSIADNQNMKLLYLAQFILELSLENLEILEHSQCQRALSALLIAKKILQIKKSWNNLRLLYNYNETEIKKVQKKMIVLLNKVMKSKTKNAIFEKFESSRYKSVSSLLDSLCNSNKKQRKEEDKENNAKYNDENKNNF